MYPIRKSSKHFHEKYCHWACAVCTQFDNYLIFSFNEYTHLHIMSNVLLILWLFTIDTTAERPNNGQHCVFASFYCYHPSLSMQNSNTKLSLIIDYSTSTFRNALMIKQGKCAWMCCVALPSEIERTHKAHRLHSWAQSEWKKGTNSHTLIGHKHLKCAKCSFFGSHSLGFCPLLIAVCSCQWLCYWMGASCCVE